MSEAVNYPRPSNSSESKSSWFTSEAGRSFNIFVQFVYLGPPVGFVALLATFPIYHVAAVFMFRTIGIHIEPDFYNNYFSDRILDGLPTLPIVLFLGFFMSYFFGGIQAMITGMVSAFWLYRFKTLPIFVPLIASILPISIYLFLYPDRLAGSTPYGDPLKIPYLLVLTVFTHLFAGGICWIKVRRNLKRSR
jgi:hypothetical protein